MFEPFFLEFSSTSINFLKTNIETIFSEKEQRVQALVVGFHVSFRGCGSSRNRY